VVKIAENRYIITSRPFFSGYGRRDAVEHLLAVGANVHARDDGGLIALHNACSFGHFEVCSLLLSHGAGGHLSKDSSH
jgi:ankyrin repeat protein